MLSNPPHIIGVLGLRPPKHQWLARLQRLVRRELPGFMCLPFECETRYLKNTIACLKLMDISALIIHGSHRKKIVRHIRSLDTHAKKRKTIDLVVKRGTRFVGMALETTSPSPLSLIRLLKQNHR